MKRVREKLATIRAAISELRYVVQEVLLLITKLALLTSALGAPIQLALSYIEHYNECPPLLTPPGAESEVEICLLDAAASDGTAPEPNGMETLDAGLALDADASQPESEE